MPTRERVMTEERRDNADVVWFVLDYDAQLISYFASSTKVSFHALHFWAHLQPVNVPGIDCGFDVAASQAWESWTDH